MGIEMRILFSGDIGPTEKMADKDMPIGPQLNRLVSSVDFRVYNLEMPIALPDFPLSPNVHPSLIGTLQSWKTICSLEPDVFTFASNHVYDLGKKGIHFTKFLAADSGIAIAGAGSNDDSARQPVFLEKNGVTVGILSYAKKGRFSAQPSRAGAALLSCRNLQKDILDIMPYTDYLIITMHMGMEFSQIVHPMQIKLAHTAIDYGADCVIGHHPHVVQGIERYKGKPIFYSLGNFLFDNYAGAVTYKGHWEARHQGLVAMVSFDQDEVGVEVYPTVYSSDEMVVRLAVGETKSKLLDELNEMSAELVSGSTTVAFAESHGLSAILSREIRTVAALTRLHGLAFLAYLVRDLKPRHLRMLFRKMASLLKGKR